jgi:hypothetical protein
VKRRARDALETQDECLELGKHLLDFLLELNEHLVELEPGRSSNGKGLHLLPSERFDQSTVSGRSWRAE